MKGREKKSVTITADRVLGETGAIEVLIFPPAMKGTGEGSYPWDLKPKSAMTNGTVLNAVKDVDGRTLTVSYKGQEKKISILPRRRPDRHLRSFYGRWTSSPARPSSFRAGSRARTALLRPASLSLARTEGGFKWSSQHLDWSCDEHSKTALGSFWAGALVLTRSTTGGRARGAAAILGSDCGRHGE